MAAVVQLWHSCFETVRRVTFLLLVIQKQKVQLNFGLRACFVCEWLGTEPSLLGLFLAKRPCVVKHPCVVYRELSILSIVCCRYEVKDLHRSWITT